MIHVIFGSTSGFAPDLISLFNKNDFIILVSRDVFKLKVQKNNLMQNGFLNICYFEYDLKNIECYSAINKLLFQYTFGHVEFYLIAGSTSTIDNFVETTNALEQFNINFKYQFEISRLALNNFYDKSVGLNFFTSIASIRGRSNNIIYSAMKRAIVSLYESTRHASPINFNIRLFYIGYVHTESAKDKKSLLNKVSTKFVAKALQKIIYKHSSGVFYIPFYWFFIRFFIKLMPWFFFKKIKF